MSWVSHVSVRGGAGRGGGGGSGKMEIDGTIYEKLVSLIDLLLLASAATAAPAPCLRGLACLSVCLSLCFRSTVVAS